MSGNNIFGELAIAFRRTIGSPIRKPDGDPSLDKSKSQSKGAVHKMKQILPHHVWNTKEKNDSIVLSEDKNADSLIERELKEYVKGTDSSILASNISNENTDNESKRKLDNYICPITTSNALLDQFYREEVLTCSVRSNMAPQSMERVRIFVYTFTFKNQLNSSVSQSFE